MLTAADTAYSIAAVRAMESDLPEPQRLFDDPYAAHFRAAGAHAEEGTQRFLALPMFREFVRIRTRFIDDVVRAGLAAGTRQIVLLGAGFDTRALRLPEVSGAGAAVYEVDFPEQIERKRSLLGVAGVALPESLRFVGCDFSAADFDRALTADLEASGYRTGAGAIFVWEGVIAYLDDAAIDRTLAFVARVGGPGSRLVFEYIEGVFEAEPFDDRTRRCGFPRFEAAALVDLWRRYLGGEPHPNAVVGRMGVAFAGSGPRAERVCTTPGQGRSRAAVARVVNRLGPRLALARDQPREGIMTTRQAAPFEPEEARRAGDGGQRAGSDPAALRARGLGWLSLGLGLAQLAAPRDVARMLGVRDSSRTRATLRAVGAREIASGLGLLTRSQPAGWAWARVAGDAMDLALLGRALSSPVSDRRRLTAGTAAVAGIAIFDFLTGRQLRRKGRPAIEVHRAITVNRPPDEVYAFWHDFQNLPRFMAHLESVEVRDGRRSHWRAKAPAGTSVEWDAEIVDEHPGQLVSWRSLPGATVPNSGTVWFSPAPRGRGTEVRVELRYEPPAGKLGAAAAKLFGEEPGQQVEGDLRRFKQVLETGEVLRSDSSIHHGPHAACPPESLEEVER